MVKHTLSMTGYPETPPETPDPVSIGQGLVYSMHDDPMSISRIRGGVVNTILKNCIIRKTRTTCLSCNVKVVVLVVCTS